MSTQLHSIAPHWQHWRLKAAPWSGRIDAAAYVASPVQNEALARLEFLIDSGKRLGLVLGPSGAGKSLTLAVLAAQQRRRGIRATRISLFESEPREFFERLAADWGVATTARDSTTSLWLALMQQLQEYRICHEKVVLLLDDLDDARADTLAQVTRLLVHADSPRWPLTIAVAGRTPLSPTVPVRLLELVDLRIDVGAWEIDDTAMFIDHSLERAGRNEAIFAPDAIARLHELAGGMVRHIEQLAELALIAGAGFDARRIDAHIIDSVHAELATC